MNKEEEEFILEASKLVTSNPSLFGHLVTACTIGIENRVRIEQERAVDFETVAIGLIALTKDNRKSQAAIDFADNLIKKKLERWNGKTSFRWG